MADEDDDGDFGQSAFLVKTRPGGRFNQNSHHHHSFRDRGLFNLQPGRKESSSGQQRGRGRSFRRSYGGYREDFHGNASNDSFWPDSGKEHDNGHFNDMDPQPYHNNEGFRQSYGAYREDSRGNASNEDFWPASGEERDNGHVNEMDPQHHHNNEGISQMRNQEHPYDRVHGRGRGRQNRQFSSDRFHDHGRGNSYARGHGHVRNKNNGRGYHHHGVSGYEDAGNFHCYGDGLKKLRPDFGGKQGKNKTFAHGRGMIGSRGRFFHGNFKRVGSSGNSTITQCVDSNKGNANIPSSADLPAKSHLEGNGDGIGSEICNRGSSSTTKVDGSAPLDIQQLDKEEAYSLNQSQLTSKCATLLSLPLESESFKEGILLQGEDATGSGDQRQQERAFISCIGGNNRKRRRSSAVRDYPERCGKLCISAVKKVVKKVITTSKDSKAPARDSVPTNSIGEVGSLSNSKLTIENFSNSNVIDVPTAEFVQFDPETIIEDCSKAHVIKEEGSAELVPSEICLDGTSSDASRVSLSEGGTLAKVVRLDPPDIIAVEDCSKTHLTKEDGPAELVPSALKAARENASRTSLSEGDTLAKLVCVSHEVGIAICSKTTSSEEYGHAEQVQASHETNIEKYSRTISCEEASPVELVHAEVRLGAGGCRSPLPEVNFEDVTETNQVDKDLSAEHAQSDLEGFNKEGTSSQINCIGHGAYQSTSILALQTWHMKLPPQGPVVAPVMHKNSSSQGNGHSILKDKKKKPTKNWRAEMQSVDDPLKTKRRHSKSDSLTAESTDASIELHNGGNVSTKLMVQDSSKVTENTGALVQNQSSKDGGNVFKKLKVPDSSEVAENTDALVLDQSSKRLSKKLKVRHSSDVTANTEALVLYQISKNISKKLKVQHSSEVTGNTRALILYKSSKNGGTMRTKDPGRRLVHKGNTGMKLYQTSRSLDSLMLNDPAKLSHLEATEVASARSLVKRTLHEFESVRKALVKSHAVRRADLEAASFLKKRGKWRNCEEKIVGEVPGIEVGDQFSFRIEMLIIGLHRQVQSGIDYILGTKRKSGCPLATSIVASGGYEDDKDDGNTLIYSGQGGNNHRGSKKQESNQALVRGNLAMHNSMKEKSPVRVIRGTSDLASPSGKVYTYDGLYDVVDFRFESGVAGYQVFHFTLTRRPGQPQVGLSFLSSLKKKGLARPHLLMNDISRGQERLPVCIVNEVDEEPAPLHFTYIPSIKYPVWYSPVPPKGCNCVGDCDEETCSCAIKNGNEFPYNENGYIIIDKKVVYECGDSCSCSSSCQNRVSQKGLRYRLEIFKTKNRGWGVRSLDSIQPGGFICEYTGELLSDAEAEQKIENDEYLFDLGNGCNPSIDQSDLVEKNDTTAIVPAAEDVAYTIDAKDLGNVARFINHSCSPNLYAQNVLYDSDDLRFPHVMLFAMENIPPMRELTYDYNYTLDKVRDAYGNVKTKACYCGAQDCQGRLY